MTVGSLGVVIALSGLSIVFTLSRVASALERIAKTIEDNKGDKSNDHF